jgi:hypothetical protein
MVNSPAKTANESTINRNRSGRTIIVREAATFVVDIVFTIGEFRRLKFLILRTGSVYAECTATPRRI